MAQAQILVAGANMLDDASVQAALAAGVSPKEITKSKCIYEVLAAACNAMFQFHPSISVWQHARPHARPCGACHTTAHQPPTSDVIIAYGRGYYE